MRVLFVSIAAPPKNEPESLQVAKVLKGLAESEIEVILVTESSTTKVTWENNSTNDYNIEEIRRIELSTYSSLVERVSRRLKISLFPDNKFLFHIKVLRALKKERLQFDMIYSRSAPISSTIAAYKVAKKYSVPWIIHMSDPWTINPYFVMSSRDRAWEKKCFEQASIITLTNNQVIERYVEEYPEYTSKFKLFPNLYDESLARPSRALESGFRLVHAGNLYAQRKPDAFLLGFESFLERVEEDMRSGILLIFIGNIDEGIKKRIERFPFKENIEIKGPVSFEESLEYQNGADVLLSIDAKFPTGKNLFFPSKLLDYMLSRKPIIAITDLGSPSYDFVHNKYGKAFLHDEIDGIAKFLVRLLEDKGKGRSLEKIKPDVNFSIKKNITEMVSLIKDLNRSEE